MRSAPAALTAALLLGCHASRAPVPEAARRFADLRAPGSDAPTVSQPCAACHPTHFAAWRRSQHAQAQRPFDPSRDLSPPGLNAAGVIGVAPLRQLLVTRPGGRAQVFDPAFDPTRRTWFSIFGAEVRSPASWGHWTQRGMNWNAQCAFCHTTDLAKGYDPETDAYATTWRAVGVACAQCHGPMAGHAAQPSRTHAPPWRARAIDNCASCHARREELTGAFRAGERFDDHFRLALADTPGAYHPDGQAAEEDFEYGSLRLSGMGQRGVGCLDCHEPHSGGLRAPITDDGLCMQCHDARRGRGAPSVSGSHAHHPLASEGARCVNCHMPRAIYMQRDRRRDHGFTIPDPVITRETGAPNACNGCHADRSVAWAEQQVDRWFGGAMERPTRSRARLIARARRGEADALPGLLRLSREEPVDGWRATAVAMLARWSTEPAVRDALLRALRDPSALVQAAAARAFGESGDAPVEVTALRGSPIRAVRVEAAWATRADPAMPSGARAELSHWVDVGSDQPAGALRRSEMAWRDGRVDEALRWAERAARWDASGLTLHALGRLRDALGDTAGALRAFEDAARAEPTSGAHPFARGLVLAAAGRTEDAVEELRRSVARDPEFGRAQYNLGLALAALGREDEAVAWLSRAESLLPDSPDPPRALAALHLRIRQRDLARAAAERAAARNLSRAHAHAVRDAAAPR